MIRSVVRGFGAALPKRVMTNRDLEDLVETSDEWIVQRTGIRQRHIAGEGETTASLGAEAAQKALDNAGLTIADIDLIICATSTPDNTFRPPPSTSRTVSACTTVSPSTSRRSVPASSTRCRRPTCISVAEW